MLLLEFDLNVLRVEQTPVHIPYRDAAGNSHTYEPPLLVTYRRDIIPAKWMPPLLCDVMTRREALRSLPGLIHRLRAARAYALRRGWEFQLLTEREIRTPYLFNAKFLLRSRSPESNPEHARLLRGTLYELRLADVETLLLACSGDRGERTRLLPTLWRLIACKEIRTDLSRPLTRQSVVWSTPC